MKAYVSSMRDARGGGPPGRGARWTLARRIPRAARGGPLPSRGGQLPTWGVVRGGGSLIGLEVAWRDGEILELIDGGYGRW